ncbi:MAG: hypothetical protein HC902_14675 [Calothrix sp. SM1_5_4]|nr:hypothetical protein [Calothrix sp. SM1_5_4]
MQSALQLQQTVFTATNLRRSGYVTGTTLRQNNVIDLGDSGFSVGVAAFVSASYFDDDSLAARANQSNYGAGLTPALEYRINSRLHLRTDSNLFVFQHLRSNSEDWTFKRQAVAQTFSLGLSITRDIYLSPGVQWNPRNPRAERTVTWLSGNVNLF